MVEENIKVLEAIRKFSEIREPLLEENPDKIALFMVTTGRKFYVPPEEQELLDKELVSLYQEKQYLIDKLNRQKKCNSIRGVRRNRYRNPVKARLKLVTKILKIRLYFAKWQAENSDRVIDS